MYFKSQPFPSSLDPFSEICAFEFSARDPIYQPIMFRELELDIEVDVDTFTVIEYSLLSFWLSKLFCFCFCFWFKNAPEMKGRYEVCGQELKLKDYIKLERNSGYVHTVTDEFWTTGHSVYTKPCESFVLFRWNYWQDEFCDIFECFTVSSCAECFLTQSKMASSVFAASTSSIYR